MRPGVGRLRVAGVQDTWWEMLPEQARQLPAELARVDAFLDDERFIAPWRAVFAERLGRPSVPVETLLRLRISSTATSSVTRPCAARSGTR